MVVRLIIIVVLTFSLSGCAVTDTAKEVFGAVGNKISGIFSGGDSVDEEKGEPQNLPKERILLHTFRGDLPLTVEIADSQEEREIGMMHRESVKLGTGMLFVFDDERPRSFWMKNTLIPLDIIFYSSKKKVVSITENMIPCDEATTNQLCPLYYSGEAAMYAFEVPAGFVAANGLRVGDEMVR